MEQIRFLTYCAEIYKRAKRMNGRQLYALFERYGVWDYVCDCYEALHTTGAEYTVQSIDAFIAVQSAG